MTYVMSDIHGCYWEYLQALEKIAFSDTDFLYIIGDIVDRGTNVVSVLKDVMGRKNVQLLAGNHEYMGLRVLGKICQKGGLAAALDDFSKDDIKSSFLWMHDGGSQTLSQLKRNGDELFRQATVFLAELPLYEEVSVGGQDFLLVHAGLKPFQSEKPLGDYGPAELLFNRADYSHSYFSDRLTITGHTPTFFSDRGRGGYILHQNNHIAIDCGCVYGYRLGIYCLETGAEYYVDSKQGDGNMRTEGGPAGKIYCISDIHGYLCELKSTLEHIDLSGGNRLVLLGDYIDYGPQSGETLRYIYDLQQQYGAEKVVVLRGNHEDAFLEWLDTYCGPHSSEPDEYGILPWNDWLNHDEGFHTFCTLVTLEQWAFFQKALSTLSEDTRNMEAARMVLAANTDLIDWLRRLPYFYETERQIFVHAGIEEEAGEWWPWATPEYMFVGKYPAATGTFYKDIIAGHVGTTRLVGDPLYHSVWWDGQNHYFIDGSIQQGGQLNIFVWDEEPGYRQWDGEWKGVEP